jgi:hypothetical protein
MRSRHHLRVFIAVFIAHLDLGHFWTAVVVRRDVEKNPFSCCMRPSISSVDDISVEHYCIARIESNLFSQLIAIVYLFFKVQKHLLCLTRERMKRRKKNESFFFSSSQMKAFLFLTHVTFKTKEKKKTRVRAANSERTLT